jgi:hypothetical protein
MNNRAAGREIYREYWWEQLKEKNKLIDGDIDGC